MSRIEMVISDFGGVLTTPLFEAFASVQDRVGIPPKSIGEAMKSLMEQGQPNPLFELECGRITELEFQRQLAESLEPILGHKPELESFGMLLFEALDPNPGMIDLIREVRRDGTRTALLTNNVKEWESTWRSMMPIGELFETVVDSAFANCRKPDPRIYQLTLERVQLEPGQCIFIDDMEINVEAARELGFHGVHFRETAQTRADVHALLAR